MKDNNSDAVLGKTNVNYQDLPSCKSMDTKEFAKVRGGWWGRVNWFNSSKPVSNFSSSNFRGSNGLVGNNSAGFGGHVNRLMSDGSAGLRSFFGWR